MTKKEFLNVIKYLEFKINKVAEELNSIFESYNWNSSPVKINAILFLSSNLYSYSTLLFEVKENYKQLFPGGL